jgi:quercetin dioxygenase-like cupin family protein
VAALVDLNELDLQEIWDGVAARSVNGERLTLAVLELDAGKVVPEHSHEHEQLGIVLRGSLTFRVGNEARELSAGGTWRIASNVPHEVHVGADGAIVIDVFAPARDDWRDRERLERAPRWPAGRVSGPSAQRTGGGVLGEPGGSPS